MSTLKRKANGGPTPEPKKAKAGGGGSIMSFFGTGSKTEQQQQAPAVKFDKARWVGSLTEEQRTLLKLEIDTLHESWLSVLRDEITTKEFLELKRFLKREEAAGKKVFPPKEDIYSWSRHTPFHTVKVVILGQDPYHNVNQAHGLAFSVRPPTPAPPSLKNMYVALRNDYPAFKNPPRNAGLLTPWAEKGVLLLNTCLTVRAHEANSHSNRGWERFTQKIIDLVAARRTKGVVFMAWGTPAGKRLMKVDGSRHLLLRAVHPSPLSASRGFFNCGHFKKANEWLVTRYGKGQEVDWSLAPGESLFKVEVEEEKVEVKEANGVKETKVEKKTTKVVEDLLDDDEEVLKEMLEAEALMKGGKVYGGKANNAENVGLVQKVNGTEKTNGADKGKENEAVSAVEEVNGSEKSD